ncbi:hypothetical protein BC940DRAFT_292463 [Gongronella butleri]|nr:hypothetical protein BC940DRAFT_292463 [Gongronella butleri]
MQAFFLNFFFFGFQWGRCMAHAGLFAIFVHTGALPGDCLVVRDKRRLSSSPCDNRLRAPSGVWRRAKVRFILTILGIEIDIKVYPRESCVCIY